MSVESKADFLKKRWSNRLDGNLMKTLFIFVCDDLDLLEELYKDDEEMTNVLNIMKNEAKEKYNGDFKKLYNHYTLEEDDN